VSRNATSGVLTVPASVALEEEDEEDEDEEDEETPEVERAIPELSSPKRPQRATGRQVRSNVIGRSMRICTCVEAFVTVSL
jgi:hypothetical protein